MIEFVMVERDEILLLSVYRLNVMSLACLR